jgi:hypothetical protein
VAEPPSNNTIMPTRGRRGLLLIPLATLAVITVLLVSPVGNFPLIDDFFHYESVQTLLESRTFELHPFQVTTFFAQALYGAFVSLLFGLDYTVLRISTLVLAFIGAWAAAKCARSYGAPHGAALLCGALLFINPIYLTLAYTFMTEVPFTAVITLSGLFFLRALQTEKAHHIALGTLFAVLAFFIRQFGPLMIIAYVAALVCGWVFCGNRVPRRVWIALLVSCVLGGGLIAAWSFTRPTTESTDSWLGIITEVSILERIWRATWYTFVAAAYIGLFSLPLLAGRAVLVLTRNETWRLGRIAMVALFVVVAFGLFLTGPGMTRLPFMPSILHDLGTGSLYLSDAKHISPRTGAFSIGPLWWPITLAAVLMAGILFTDSLTAWRKRTRQGQAEADLVRTSQSFFLFFWGFLFVARFMPFLPGGTGDRYLLPTFAAASIWAVTTIRLDANRLARIATAAALLGMYGISIACVHDYLAWNRARWEALDWLQAEQHASPNQIDGGYEFNGSYTLEEFRACHEVDRWGEFGDPGWWVVEDQFAINFRPREGFEVIREFPYHAWLGYTSRHIVVNRRI